MTHSGRLGRFMPVILYFLWKCCKGFLWSCWKNANIHYTKDYTTIEKFGFCFIVLLITFAAIFICSKYSEIEISWSIITSFQCHVIHQKHFWLSSVALQFLWKLWCGFCLIKVQIKCAFEWESTQYSSENVKFCFTLDSHDNSFTFPGILHKSCKWVYVRLQSEGYATKCPVSVHLWNSAPYFNEKRLFLVIVVGENTLKGILSS